MPTVHSQLVLLGSPLPGQASRAGHCHPGRWMILVKTLLGQAKPTGPGIAFRAYLVVTLPGCFHAQAWAGSNHYGLVSP